MPEPPAAAASMSSLGEVKNAVPGRGTPIMTDSVTEPEMGRLNIRLNRARNLRGPELLSKKDCYVVFTFEKRRVASSVKYGTVAPVWDQDYYMDKVSFPPTSKVAITVVYKGEKKDEVLGVAAPGQHLWTKGTETPVDKWLPIATKDGIYAGELNFHLHWTKCEPEYREVFKRIGGVVHSSRGLSRVFNSQIDHAVDGLLGVLASTQAWFASRSSAQLTGMGVGVAAAGAVFFIPAMLLLPLAITFAVVISLTMGPLLLGLGWCLFTSAPVQDRMVKPLIDRALKNERIRGLVTKQIDQ